MKSKKQVQAEEKIGDVFETDVFTEYVKDGCFIPYDGYGYYHDGEKETEIEVFDGGIYDVALSKKYPYVIWFNR